MSTLSWLLTADNEVVQPKVRHRLAVSLLSFIRKRFLKQKEQTEKFGLLFSISGLPTKTLPALLFWLLQSLCKTVF